LRIDLSDGKFIQYYPTRTTKGSCTIERREDVKGSQPLGALKIPVVDMVKVFTRVMLDNGITPGEIVAQVFAQVHNLNPEVVEFLMRR